MNEKAIRTNCGDKGHVVKFICGIGRHSESGEGVLKKLLFEEAKKLGHEAYMNEAKGNVLVRLAK